jgi:SAM-dependent methyltransferase
MLEERETQSPAGPGEGVGAGEETAACEADFRAGTGQEARAFVSESKQPEPAMDPCAITASAFSQLADKYREKYMDLTLYDEFYREFCGLLPPGSARVLDAACGPGNVSRFLMTERPDLELLGIDLAPRMVELAGAAVPSARFVVHDCRELAGLQRRFDGIICAFGLPYLSPEEAAAFIRASAGALDAGGALYLSVMLGRSEDSGVVHFENGNRVFVHYHDEGHILRSVEACGFSPIRQIRMPSPSNASKATTDLILIAKR